MPRPAAPVASATSPAAAPDPTYPGSEPLSAARQALSNHIQAVSALATEIASARGPHAALTKSPLPQQLAAAEAALVAISEAHDVAIRTWVREGSVGPMPLVDEAANNAAAAHVNQLRQQEAARQQVLAEMRGEIDALAIRHNELTGRTPALVRAVLAEEAAALVQRLERYQTEGRRVVAFLGALAEDPGVFNWGNVPPLFRHDARDMAAYAEAKTSWAQLAQSLASDAAAPLPRHDRFRLS